MSISAIAEKIKGAAPLLFEHLLKLFYFRDDRSFNNWRTSVYKALCSLPKCAHNGKFPGGDFIERAVWSGKFDRSNFKRINDRFVKGMNNSAKYSELPEIYEDGWIMKNAYNFCKGYISFMAAEIEEKGKVEIDDAFNEIDFLLSKLPCD